MNDQTSPETETATLEQLQDLQRRADIPHLPTQQTYEARMAVSREGPRAYDWEDKPHRIVYDLCREIERLSAGHAQTPAVQEALDLAVNIIMANEPGDSRAVSDEAVALAAVACGDTSDAVMKVIRDALAVSSTARPAQTPAVLDESDPKFCAMVNAARDEHFRLKGFHPYSADIIAMLKAALAKGQAITAHETPAVMVKGNVYQLNSGPAEYVGLDTFHGETTHHFRDGRGSIYILPEHLAARIDRTDK